MLSWHTLLSVTRIKLFGRHLEVRSLRVAPLTFLRKMVKKYIFWMQVYSSEPQALILFRSLC